MSVSKNHNKFLALREQYPDFEYQSYSINKTSQSLDFSFLFKMGDVEFKPAYSIPYRRFYRWDDLDNDLLESLVFHIGMVELISYWKSACPSQVIIRPFHLDEQQVKFWKKLYFNGLGEFLYLNGINIEEDDLMDIRSGDRQLKKFSVNTDAEKVLVPVGGGKDSVVTLELLKEMGDQVIPMAVNPREAVERTIRIAGYSMDESVVVNRTLDKKLLELNQQGYLNGHTPFSALLAFVTSLTAVLSGAQYIALSNESSANESTVPGSNVNHQYSKSFEFEHDFREYFKNYITPDVHYFSFLRPLNELQIAALFSRFPQHHESFRSCNVGSKTDSWCAKCPKCLFTRIILGPFFDQEKLKKIFSGELLNDKTLKPHFEELTGKAEVKPFECVGTPHEVNAALAKIKMMFSEDSMPALLSDFPVTEKEQRDFEWLLQSFNDEHALPEKYLKRLKERMP